MSHTFHVMTKPTGAICNLDCEYCFFLAKEQLYPGSSFRMPEDVHAAYIEQLLAAHADAPEVVVAFQGGEPTMMGLEFFVRTLEVQRQFARPGQQILNTIQTNATLITDEWADFLAEHDFLVGVSIDGPRETHDAYRVDKGGKPTFDRVMAGLRRLQAAGVEWNALTTVHAATGDHGVEIYRFLRDDLGARFMQFIPIVEQGRAYSVGAEQYGRFMIEVFEEWARHDVGDVFVQAFDTALAHWLGMDQVGLCVHARTCGDAVALEHTGDLYSCDHFVEPEHLLGNITAGRTLLELVESPQQRAFGEAKLTTLPRYCQDCEVRFACNGGCPKDRFLMTPDGEPGLHFLCPGYKAFFTHIDAPMQVMATALRAGRDAIDIRDWYAEADATRSRNDPCSCGSGRKWKKCHGVSRPTPD